MKLDYKSALLTSSSLEELLLPSVQKKMGTLHRPLGCLEVELDKQERIQVLAWRWDGDENLRPWFLALSVAVKGKTLLEALELEEQDLLKLFEDQVELPFMMVPLLVLREMINEYLGETHHLRQLLGQKEDDLICRCMSLYRSEIQEYLDQTQGEISFKSLSVKTRAGLGCGSCCALIEQIILDENHERADVLRSIHGKTPAQVALLLHKHLPEVDIEKVLGGAVYAKSDLIYRNRFEAISQELFEGHLAVVWVE